MDTTDPSFCFFPLLRPSALLHLRRGSSPSLQALVSVSPASELSPSLLRLHQSACVTGLFVHAEDAYIS